MHGHGVVVSDEHNRASGMAFGHDMETKPTERRMIYAHRVSDSDSLRTPLTKTAEKPVSWTRTRAKLDRDSRLVAGARSAAEAEVLAYLQVALRKETDVRRARRRRSATLQNDVGC